MIESSISVKAGAIIVDAQIHDKKELFSFLAELAHKQYGANRDQVFDCLDERERLGSTGFGGGIAIPHGKLSQLSRPVGILIRLADSMPFNAVDSLPIDLVFCLLSPSHGGSLHLKALAAVSRLLRDEKSVAKLRGAAQSDAIYALLAGTEERDAA